MNAPAALYRRYRPDTFQDVIGQEHVTEPLMTALRKNRVNHAYLFSGPRGCGKTTSARILARCLNCEQGPTPEPCGVCPSCVELARGGSGSLDVIEIDAASHGGVDDARDLRERATFAPVRDRYKIFIIDEAHMVTSAGFNALLKIVEEPPEHIKFIFATTEPDKVIGTIRSRTHHYPFRLVPPEPLLAYLEQLCAAENVPVAPGVLSLVIRAGGGSVRDSLSVLDQLMAGAGSSGIDYELAVALLGYTHASLLDDVVDAMSAGDSGTVFRAVDRVIQTGHDPRRFVEDLLERFRDLIIVQALPDAAESILRGVPADQLARMRVQAQNLGGAELSRAADVTNEAFNEMTGATSPRLHLELLCARLMLPAADAHERGWAARVDRLERRLSFAHDGAGSAPAVESAPPVAERSEAESKPAAAPPPVERSEPPAIERSEPPAIERSEPPAVERSVAESKPHPAPAAPAPHAAAAPPAPASAQSGGAGSVEMFRRAWPEILDGLAKVKRSTWALVGPNASVAGFDGRTLALAFGTSGLAAAFTRGDHSDNLRKAIHGVLGVDCQIDAVTGGNGPGTAPTAGGEERPKAPADPPRGTPVPAASDRPGPARPDTAGSSTAGPSTAGPGPEAPASVSDAQPPRRVPRGPEPRPSPAQPSAHAARPAATPPAAPSAADVAWGLAPSPAAASVPAAAPATASAPAPVPVPAPARAGAPAPATAPAPRVAQAPAPSGQAASGQPAGLKATPPSPRRPEPAPTPYDDIPYSDEEPGGEWDEPYPEDTGYSAPRERPRPNVPTVQVPASAPAAPAPRPAVSDAPAATAADPWAFAREGAPGVWTVGTEPNAHDGGASAAGQLPRSGQERPGGVAASGAPAPEATQPSATSAPSYAPATAQPPRHPPVPGADAPAGSPVGRDSGRRLSMYERLSRKAAAEQAPVAQTDAPQEYVEDIPSADDEMIEQSSIFGRAAVERILGGKLIEERALDGTVIPPR